jgi:Ca-activated chloride channel homolog
MASIYQEIAKMEKNELGTDRMNIFEEQYQWFLVLALFFLLLEFFIPDIKTVSQEWKGRIE